MSATPEQVSTTVGGQAVLNEAIQVAIADLEAGDSFTPIVVTKDWGDPQVERFAEEELAQARARMHELLGGGNSGHCALAYLEQVAEPAAIVVQVARMGNAQGEAFIQRYRPRRGRFRPFKLLGTPMRASEAPAGDSDAPQPLAVSAGARNSTGAS